MKNYKPLTCGFVRLFDKHVMLKRLAPLRGGAPHRKALGRAIAISGMVIAVSVAGIQDIETANAEDTKPLNIMNLKLYLHNQLNDWDQFECANQLGIKESNWNYKAVNNESKAYGIFQHMSKYAKEWDAYTQIDKHIIYIDSRYEGDWCKALTHLENKGWH